MRRPRPEVLLDLPLLNSNQLRLRLRLHGTHLRRRHTLKIEMCTERSEVPRQHVGKWGAGVHEAGKKLHVSGSSEVRLGAVVGVEHLHLNHLRRMPLHHHVRALVAHPETRSPLLPGHLYARGVEVHGNAIDCLHFV